MITARMAQAAPVTITIDGNYNPGTGNGNASIRFQNDSSAAIDGRVIIVITEDSLFYPAPNGAMWHCHVPRDYLPDNNGTIVSMPAGNYVDVNQSFSIDPIWNDDQCKLIAFIQNDVMQADSTKEIWQGAIVDILEIGIEEREAASAPFIVKHFPNPARNIVNFCFQVSIGTEYRIDLYDITGRKIRAIQGIAVNEKIIQNWDLRNSEGEKADPGIYLFRIVCAHDVMSGKVVVE
ncbi:hypothetical protein A2Y85_01725 [candidate division WOR-3 bacterium RBG_13_43_14]|uniref:Secretion system C-terminal sorting domain-containing protein n=1 Tax=candidate division WOR-3 bacterium RBG_13_43_14 TaxID=1802590 RepID=A0A1F4U3N8_UNCW3|nr:MAG: hypothetical protein A2Y85_01725 [candidate division WOR-3 bacterium RBG_13_43_14]